MKSRSIHFLLTATTIASSGGIFIFSSPAKAHTFDYCVDVLREEAEIAVTGEPVFDLKEENPEDYQEIKPGCNQELEENGLLTIKDVTAQNEAAAKAVLDGRADENALNPAVAEKQEVDLENRETKVENVQDKICTNPTPEQEFACPNEESSENGEVTPQAAVPKANNTLVAAALQFGKQITQILTGTAPAHNTLAATIPQTGSDTPQTGLYKPGSTLVAQASSVGQWSGLIDWPHIVIHAAVGPNGNVLTWTRPKLSPTTHPKTGKPVPKYTLWNPANNSFSSVPDVNTDIFCAAHAFAPSGNLLVVGGHTSDVAGDGSKDINVYNFRTNSWFQYPNKMNAGRWYPTVTYNSLGEGVIVGGSVTNEGDLNPNPQVWGTGGGANVRTLSGASLALPVKPYVWNFAAPSGRIFNAGPTQTTRALSTTGTGKWTTVSNHVFGNRYYGSAVMYDEGKILVMGGSNTFYGPPTKTAEVIELLKSTQWIPVAEMSFARRHHTATLLADGKVFVSGGTSDGSFNDTTNKVLAGEIWDPVTTQWTTVPSMQVTRSYHQTAVLLPDARVLVVGGGLPVGNTADSQGNFNAEIYSPPYLFNGDRPTITSTPTNISYGQTFTVGRGTPSAGDISKVHWIRLSSFTHQFDQNQRISRLTIQSQSSNSLSVKAPSDKKLCPPGHYMMFLLNSNGVPSVAKVIKIS